MQQREKCNLLILGRLVCRKITHMIPNRALDSASQQRKAIARDHRPRTFSTGLAPFESEVAPTLKFAFVGLKIFALWPNVSG